MRKLSEIYEDICTHIKPDFPRVRCSSARTPKQMAREVEFIGRESLPAVILFLDGIQFLKQKPPLREMKVPKPMGSRSVGSISFLMARKIKRPPMIHMTI